MEHGKFSIQCLLNCFFTIIKFNLLAKWATLQFIQKKKYPIRQVSKSFNYRNFVGHLGSLVG